jgi:hypothetical protein
MKLLGGKHAGIWLMCKNHKHYFDGQYQTSKCINSFLDSDVKKRAKNQLCFILYQDKAFEDKMN